MRYMEIGGMRLAGIFNGTKVYTELIATQRLHLREDTVFLSVQ